MARFNIFIQPPNIIALFVLLLVGVEACKPPAVTALRARPLEQSFVPANTVGLSFKTERASGAASQGAGDLIACLNGDFLVEQASRRIYAQTPQSKAQLTLTTQGECDQNIRILTYDEGSNLIGDSLKGVKQGEVTRVTLDLQKGDAVELSLEDAYNCSSGGREQEAASLHDPVKLVLGRCPLNL